MQLDYVFFVYGFAFIFLAAILWPIVSHGREKLPWRWLIAFGFLHGVNEWLDLTAMVLGDGFTFKVLRLAVLVTSFAALFEFGRRGRLTQKRSFPPAWIHVPLVLIVMGSGWFGLTGLSVACRYVYGFPAALLAGLMLLTEARDRSAQGGYLLRIAAWCWMLFAVAAGLVVSPGPFFPSTMLNTQVFHDHLGFPVEVVRAALAIVIAICTWFFLATRTELAGLRMRWSIRFYVVLSILLVAGSIFCNAVAKHARTVVLSESATRFAWLADNLERSTIRLGTIANTMAASPHIAPALTAPDSTQALENANRVLDRYAGGLENAVTYLINTKGLTIASSNRNAPDRFVGKKFTFRPYFKQALEGKSSRYFALGVVSLKCGLYCSAPVRSPHGDRILGVAVVKHTFAGTEGFFPGTSNYVLLSPEGVVFLTGNAQWALRTLYPVPQDEMARLRTSQQFGDHIGTPLLPVRPKPLHDVVLNGKPHCFLHKSVGDGWSIAIFEPLRLVALYRLFAILLVMLLGLLLLTSIVGLVHNALMSERNFREVFNSSKDAMILHDVNGTILDVNTAARRAFALAPDDVPGLNIGQISAEEGGYSTELGLITLREALEKGLARFEWRSRRRTGATFWTEVTLNRSQIGGRDHVLAVVRDIDDRKKSEQALRDSEAHFRQLFENMSSAVFVCDSAEKNAGFTICDVNSAAERMVGEKRATLFGRSLREIFPTHAAALHEKFRQAAKMGQAQFLSTREGEEGETSKRVEHRVFRLPSGRIVCLSDDRTEIQALEERLRQSEKLCAIGQLAGGIAHDFNNQLTAVLGSAELLLMRAVDERQRQFADLIVHAARRSRDLTSQLLAFARRGRYLEVRVDLHAIIDEVLSLAERSFPRNITIKRELHAEATATVGDPTQLQNAFLNLALNARDAMPSGGELTFETTLQTLENEQECSRFEGVSPGTFVRIRIADTGVGMDEQTLKHLYEPFFTTKPTGEGTGLGLAAVYGTVKSHHGGISVCSEIGRGTTFDLLFPLVLGTDTKPKDTQSMGYDRKHGQILIIDDDEIVCRMTAILLRELGCTPFVCNGGRRGLEYYREHWESIDLVVLDMIMPEMSGREVFLELMKINPQVKVLLASGHSIDGEAQTILDLGANDFLQKPFELHELSEKLSVLLGKSLRADDKTSAPDTTQSST